MTRQHDNDTTSQDRAWPGFLPVDGKNHGGEDPDPTEADMPHWAPNLDLPQGAK